MRLKRFLISAIVVFLSAISTQPVLAQLAAVQVLSPTDLTTEEADFYKSLDAVEARRFLATRSYVRMCYQVEEGKLPAIQLPARPPGFDIQYLLPQDPTVINRAVADYIVAKNTPDHSAHPHHLEMTPAQLVSPTDLTKDEADYYKTLAPADAKSFILTRSFVRLCRKTVDHQLPALQLPSEPMGFNPEYLLPGEKQVVDEAISALLSELMSKKLK
jgi:hypothetical protein